MQIHAIKLLALLLSIVILDSTLQTQTTAPMKDLKEPRLVISKSKRTLTVFDGDTKIVQNGARVRFEGRQGNRRRRPYA
jgi:hypothetical protein